MKMRKAYNKLPKGVTAMQKAAVDNLLSGNYKTKKAALLAAGYSKYTSDNPQLIYGSAKSEGKLGVKRYLDTFDLKAQARFKQTLKSKLQDVYLDGLEAVKPYGKRGDIHPDYSTRLSYEDRIAEMLSLLEPKGAGEAGQQVFNFFMLDNKQRNKFNEAFAEFVRKREG